ncbi:carboxypeptidase regulatory-like domain-containing protein [Candidatus Uhrbacteria bacterium]|nr:carboxypeptidase regulatory-like domain-containing protein [Candidatus Uhrbacteria bacterium]
MRKIVYSFLGVIVFLLLAGWSYPAEGQEADQAGPAGQFNAPVRFTVTVPDCFDGLDNDGDQLIDYPDDPDCSSRLDEDESEPVSGFIAPVIPQAVPEQTTRAIVRVLDNPKVEQAAVELVSPIIAVSGAANAASAVATGAVGFGTLLIYLQGFFTQPLLLFTRRRRKEWGIIYSSLTKLPVDLAVVRLFNGQTGRLTQTRVSDKQGRYLFLVDPGNYRMEVSKPGFSFPSGFLQDKKSDLDFTELYHGELLEATLKSTTIARPIPIDPLQKDETTPRNIFARRRLRAVQKGLAWSGPVFAAAALAIRPTLTTAVLLAVQLGFLGLFRRIAEGKRPRPWGSVVDALSGRPLALAVIRIFDGQFNKLLDTQITDRHGRYAFLVGRGAFYITAEKPGYAEYRSRTLDFTSVETTEIVHQDIKLASLSAVQRIE